MCGEQIASLSCFIHRSGSPPRVRGTVPHKCAWRKRHGITPACAGNSGLGGVADGASRDHPRVCGEQSSVYFDLISGKGSPPRVRGTEDRLPDTDGAYRITPACAGNSCFGYRYGRG